MTTLDERLLTPDELARIRQLTALIDDESVSFAVRRATALTVGWLGGRLLDHIEALDAMRPVVEAVLHEWDVRVQQQATPGGGFPSGGIPTPLRDEYVQLGWAHLDAVKALDAAVAAYRKAVQG